MEKWLKRDVPVMILIIVVVSYVAFSVRGWISAHLHFSVPDAVELQELAVKGLSGQLDEGSHPRPWTRVGDGYVFDYFNLINFDKTAGTVEISRSDAVNHRIKHVADLMIFVSLVVVGGIVGGFFICRKSKYYYIYLPWLALISLSFAVVVNRQCQELNVEYGSKKFAEKCDRDSVKQILQLIDKTEASGRREFRGHRLFVGKKRNFGIDFAAVTIDDCEYIYIVKDDPTQEQLSDSPQFWSWRKNDDHIYICRHDNTREFIHGLRAKLTGCRSAFVLLFLVCIGATLVNAAMVLLRRKPAADKPNEA